MFTEIVKTSKYNQPNSVSDPRGCANAVGGVGGDPEVKTGGEGRVFCRHVPSFRLIFRLRIAIESRSPCTGRAFPVGGQRSDRSIYGMLHACVSSTRYYLDVILHVRVFVIVIILGDKIVRVT